MQKNLFRRGKTYNVRVQIPKDLISCFGRKEIVRSLQTKDYQQARLLLREIQSATERLFFFIRNDMIDKGQLASILKYYIESGLRDFETHRLAEKKRFAELEQRPRQQSNPFRYVEVNEQLLSILGNSKPLQLDIRENEGLPPGIIPDIDFTVDVRNTPLGEKYIADAENTADCYRQIAEGIRKDSRDYNIPSHIFEVADELFEQHGITIEKDTDEYSTFCRRLSAVQVMYYSELANRIEGKADYAIKHQVDELLQEGYPVTFKQAVGEFLDSKRIAGIKDSTIRTYERICRLLNEHYKDALVKDLNNRALQGYIVHTRERKSGIKNVTLLKHIKITKEIISLACINHSIPSWKYKIDLKDDSADIKPFSGTELNHIFQHLNNPKIKSWQYWACLTALLTGLRQGEICALTVEDIQNYDDVWFISVRDSKTKAGIRDVPISDTLLNLGFIQFWRETKRGHQKHLFMATVKREYVPLEQNTLCDWFRKFKKAKQFIRPGDEDVKRFHSFRHNFADALKQGGVVDETRKELCGHKEGGVHASYTEVFRLPSKLAAINKARWDCDFSKLKTWKASNLNAGR